MAMTRAEIELLIKARNQAQGALDQLGQQIGRVTGESQKASGSIEGMDKATKGAGAGATAAGVAFGLLAERVGRALVGGFNDTVQAANRLDAALAGLSAVAKGFNVDTNAAQQAAKDFAANGLISVADAATALKNLLSVGYGLDESMALLRAHADAAAYNRQGMLGFGESIVRVTDGLKFNNSQLTDSTGLGRNLSAAMKDAGLSQDAFGNAVNDSAARQAYLNSVLKDSKNFLGNAAEYADSAAGKQAAFGAAVEKTAGLIGKQLQPVLGSLLSTLEPLVRVVGENASVFVPMGLAVAAVVGPLAAMQAAAALGIPSISGLGTSMASTLAIFKGVRTFGDARAGIQLVGEAAGLTTAKLGYLGTAVSVAAAAFVGWQIGKVIDELTGASTAVEALTNKVMGYSAALNEQVAGAKQDVINRAIKAGAAASISYADAIKYNTQVDAIRVAQFDKSAAAQTKRIEAELALGRITLEQANAQKAVIAGEQQAAQVRQSRLQLTDAVKAAEKAYADEVKATGYSVQELTKFLKDDEAGFDAWAKKVDLSDATVKRLKDSLKAKEDQHKRNQKAAEDHAQAQKKLRDELEQLTGVLTQQGLTERMARLHEILGLAGKVSTPALNSALIAIIPTLKDYRDAALKSGLATGEIDTALTRATAAAKAANDALMASLPELKATVGIVGELPGQVVHLGTVEEQLASITRQNLAGSYKYFGVTSRDELQKTAREAAIHYQNIAAAVGKHAPEAVAAYKKMVDAQKAATMEVPSYWQSTVFPAIRGTVEQIGTAVQGTFAQMLLGAKGFGDGFQDIWQSIKKGVLNILNSILSTFLNSFLKGMLGAMAGQQGAFGQAFAGLMGGARGGGGGWTQMIGMGTQAAAGGMAMPGTAVNMAGLGIPGVGGGAGTGAAGGGSMFSGLGSWATSGVGSSVVGGGVGFGVGFGLGNKYGKTTGILSGIGSGAATGAMLGGPYGAIIGAAAGLIGGLIGGARNNTAGDREKFTKTELGLSGGTTELWKVLEDRLPPELAADLRDRALNQIGKKDTKANLAWMQDVMAALDKYKDKRAETAAAAEAAAAREAAAMEAVRVKLQDQIATIDSELQSLEQSIAQEAPEEVMGVVEAQARARIDQLRKERAALQQEMQEATKENVDAAGASLDDMLDAVKDRMRTFKVVIPVEYAMPDDPGGERPEPEPEGGAAAGVMANRPGLVLFGEGGEPEVGGPASFFRRIFEDLGVSGGDGLAGGGNTFNFNVTTMDANGFKSAVENQILPMIVDAVAANRRGSRTNLTDALGV